MSSVFIHIGYQKTGSTWLRQNLLNNDKLGFVSPYSRSQLLEQIVYPHALDFDPRTCRDFFEPEISRTRESGQCLVLSLERLAGNPVSGCYDSKELADRIAKVFPEAKIFMVIREQNSMILSSYKQYVKGGGPSSLKEYVTPPPPKRIPYFEFDNYTYHRLINHYQALFGQSNLLVLPFEYFVESPNEFAKRIVSFTSAHALDRELLDNLPYNQPENVGLSAFEIALKRRMSMLFGARNSLNLHSLFPAMSFEHKLFWGAKKIGVFNLVPPSIRRIMDNNTKRQLAEMTTGRYAESNSITSELIGIDLSEYGYQTERRDAVNQTT